MSNTVPPLVSLSPISRSAGRSLLIKNLDDPNTSFILGCVTVQLYSRPFSSFIPSRVTVHLFTNNSALFPAVLLYSFIPGHVTVQHYSRPFQVLFPTVFDYLSIIALITIKVSYDNTGIVYTCV